MTDIDEERLQTLMELVNKEHADLDPYVIWVLCVNHLLNEQGLYGDEAIAQEIRDQRNKETGYNIRVI
jgi:hypothetical protein